MKKKLSEMSLEELWILFPIILKEHDNNWQNIFNEEKEYLLSFLPIDSIINHIGSTAIKDIYAKPIIDILIELKDLETLNLVKDLLISKNYLLMNSNNYRASLNKGYSDEGFLDKVFHIHLRIKGDNDEIYFKDYLNKHYDVRKEYETLKLELAIKYKNNRDAYTDAKTNFVKKYTNIAKKTHF